MHASSPHLIDVLGTLVGATGVCIAVYLRFVHPSRVEWRYSVGFFVFGAVLLVLHTEFYVPLPSVNLLLRVFGLVAALAVEVAAFVHVLRVTERRESVRDAIGETADDLFP